MITAYPGSDELSLRRNKPSQGGEINPCPHVLGIHNCEDTDLTMDSSKPCVTGINSPAVQGRTNSSNRLNSIPPHASYRDRQLRSFAHFNPKPRHYGNY
ncbi:hypothetical protein PIB30_009788 [Stylosanthes scabra]|uniref:Uncharacterized protein n=1 Tax=Stylosanthes scabra TaxID=79078 RepID=A0ABU6Y709_9FABA|nr:hypothetical protein [Stylosanthes scabra]